MDDLTPKEKIQKYFQAGDVPTEQQFSEFINLATDVSALDAGTSNGTLDNNLLATEITGKTISSSTFSGNGSGLTNLNASNVTSGTLPVAQVPDLNASKITAGQFTQAHMPDSLEADTLSDNGAGLTAVNATNITTGTLPTAQVPNLDASKIASGEFNTDRIANLHANKVNQGRFTQDRMPENLEADTLSDNGAGLTAVSASNITTGTLPVDQVPNLNASKITAGQFTQAHMPDSLEADTLSDNGAGLTAVNATNITTGTLPDAQVPNLDASKITSGEFNTDRIANLHANKVNQGRFTQDRMPENLEADTLSDNGAGLTAINASNITTGTLPAAQIPNLNASKITAGQLSQAQMPASLAANSLADNGAGLTGINATNITTGTLPVNQVPNLDASKITSGQLSGSSVFRIEAEGIDVDNTLNSMAEGQILALYTVV